MSTISSSQISVIPSYWYLTRFLAHHAIAMMNKRAEPQSASSRRSFHHFGFAKATYKVPMPLR